MARPKKTAGSDIEVENVVKTTNDANVTIQILVNNHEEIYEITVKDFCANVNRVNQKPETVLAAMLEGLELRFGKRLSVH
jgi:hypothetical protein